MAPVTLITSVPDLQVARICAAAGVPMIAMVQTHPDIIEISRWLEGTDLLVQIIDPDLPIPPLDQLIIPLTWYDAFSFMDKKCLWMTSDPTIYRPDGMIYSIPYEEILREGEIKFFPFVENSNHDLSWLDYENDFGLFEKLFL